MSSARIQKLKSLLARVEQRRAQPRLHAVPGAPLAAAPAPTIAVADDFDDDELFAKTDPPPALLVTERKPAKSPASPPASPLEDAMALLDGSGPLTVQSLAEPIAMRPTAEQPLPRASEPPRTPAPVGRGLEPAPAPVPRAAEPLVRPRMSAPDPSMFDRAESSSTMPVAPVEFRPAPASPRSSGSVREQTLRFDTGVDAAAQPQVDIGNLPPEAAPEPGEQRPASQRALPLTAASHVVEPGPLSSAVAPARAVSVARIEAPRSFGELLELSLALRPR